MDRSGERFVPQQADPYDEISIEHQQRYHAVKNLVRGKSVLDAGSGEGYGAYLLSETAAWVAGIDISPEAVDNARITYRRQNLEYRTGSVGALPFDDGSFDVVVSFEVIEHLEEEIQAAFLGEVRRVLKEAGILVISTPNKATYTDDTNLRNQFHKKEFYVDEFESFLRRFFPRVSLFGQSWFVSSVLDKPVSGHLENIKLSDQVLYAPKYVVAVCGATGLVSDVDLSSLVIDRGGRFERMRARIVELQAEVQAKNSWALSLTQELEGMSGRIIELQTEVVAKNSWALSLTQELEGMSGRILELQREVEAKNSWALSLDQEIRNIQQVVAHYKKEAEDALQRIVDLNAELASLRTELESIKQSDFWKVATHYWRLRDAWLPPGSRRRRMLKGLFRLLKACAAPLARAKRGDSAGAKPETPSAPKNGISVQTAGLSVENPVGVAPIKFAMADKPKVSIIIPALNQWEHTYRCMQSIQQNTAGVPCEIILADDGSTDPTVRAEEILTGVRVLRDGQNRGFLRNCNRAAAEASGEYLYFLNNDTKLQAGAIHALVALLDRDPGIGMVGSKLVYPDGRLQEAGGIIWADASGWNFGRGEDPSLPAFNYVKEVDYVSGASFMVRKDLWKEIGGFDDRYAPAYCEDSDLAFEVRRRGCKVMFQPESVVVHFEGASHGTDVAQNTKAHQVRNTEALKAKWAGALAHQLPNGTDVFHARDRSAGRKAILVIDHYVPHFDKDAGSRTMWSFLQAFLKMGMNVKFLGDNFFPHQPYTHILQQAGIEVLVGPWFADHWQEWLAANGHAFDFVFLSRPHIAPKYLHAVRTHTAARFLYYVHDLHYLRELQLAELNDDFSLKARAERDKAKEQQLMKQMHVVFSCSHTEVDIIRGLCPDVDVLYVPPYSVDVDLTCEFKPGKREGLLFVGGFSHPPNADAVIWFVREVWPDVKRQLPDVVLSIAGSAPPQEVLALASGDVRVLGFVSEDRLMELYHTSKLVVIPLRYGAGVKGKTVEAMAHGVPVVCTEWGVEGMPGVEEVLDPIQYRMPLAEGIAGLYNDDSRLEEISRKERDYVARHFTLEKIQESFARAIAPRELPSELRTPGMCDRA